MKSIANQYRDLKEGRMSQANFMRNLRMTMPQYVTNVTSFNDAVRILKSKSILTEDLPGMASGMHGSKDFQKAMGIEDDSPYEENDDEIEAIIKKMEQEKEGEEAIMAQHDPLEESLNEGKGKDLHPNQIHPQELSMGIKVEMEHTKDAEKAKKIALDHLAENPFYYTQLKLSSVDVKATPSKEKKAIAKKKDETELVDKANQMKPVKGVEKAKASANKATKETNKPVKGISLMSLIAKTSRGVQKMTATGEKMKVVKEDYQSFLAQKKSEEEASETYNGFKKGDKVMVDSEAADALKLSPSKVYTISNFRVIKKGSMLQSVDAMLDNGDSVNVKYLNKAPKAFNPSINLGNIDLKKLTELVYEVLDEMQSADEVTADVALGLGETMDGRDNLTDTAGHQLDENK